MDAQPASQASQGPPSASSVLWAEWRRGLKDMQNIVLNPWQGWAATHEEPGTIANPTNFEVFRERHQESSHSQISARNEVFMEAQPSVRSPADLAEGRMSGPDPGQQQISQQMSPADLLEAKQNGHMQGQGQPQGKPDLSPADLSEGKGVSEAQPQQAQRQGQSHSLSL